MTPPASCTGGPTLLTNCLSPALPSARTDSAGLSRSTGCPAKDATFAEGFRGKCCIFLRLLGKLLLRQILRSCNFTHLAVAFIWPPGDAEHDGRIR